MENSTELVSLRGMIHYLPEFLQLLRNKKSLKRQEAIRSYVNLLLWHVDNLSGFEDELAETGDEKDEQEIAMLVSALERDVESADENTSRTSGFGALTSPDSDPCLPLRITARSVGTEDQSNDWSRFYTADGMPRGVF